MQVYVRTNDGYIDNTDFNTAVNGDADFYVVVDDLIIRASGEFTPFIGESEYTLLDALDM